MSDSLQLLYLTDADGHALAVQIPLELWQKIEPLARPLLAAASEAPTTPDEPLAAFEDFRKYWDFPYPYNPGVTCPHCGASTADWRADPEHPFVLSNANLGGLLVFRCKACGTSIRQKHFKDHVALEHSAPKS